MCLAGFKSFGEGVESQFSFFVHKSSAGSGLVTRVHRCEHYVSGNTNMRKLTSLSDVSETDIPLCVHGDT